MNDTYWVLRWHTNSGEINYVATYLGDSSSVVCRSDAVRFVTPEAARKEARARLKLGLDPFSHLRVMRVTRKPGKLKQRIAELEAALREALGRYLADEWSEEEQADYSRLRAVLRGGGSHEVHMKRVQYKNWENETHVVTVYKVVNKLEDQDFDPIASFFDSDREEALKFAKKFSDENPDVHVFVYRAAIEPWKLLFDSDPDASERALKNLEQKTLEQPSTLDDIESEW